MRTLPKTLAIISCLIGVAVRGEESPKSTSIPTVASSMRSDEAERIDELIRQLGDARFGVREFASGELIKIGGSALGPLAAQRGVADNEMRLRIARVTRIIRDNELQRRLQVFLFDEKATLPGWDVFSKLMGVDYNARDLYVEVYREDPAAFADLGNRDVTLSSLERIFSNLDSHRSIGVRLGERAVVTVAILYSSLLPHEASIPRALRDDVASTFELETVQSVVKSSKFGPLLRQFLMDWVTSGDDGVDGVVRRLRLAATYELPQGLQPATDCLKARVGFTEQLLEALQIVAHHGDHSHIAIVESYLNDSTFVDKIWVDAGNNQRRAYTTQLGDVALAALIKLVERPFADFGLDLMIEPEDNGRIDFRRAGFAEQGHRQAAIDRWIVSRRIQH